MLLLCFIQIIIVPEHKVVDLNIKIVGRYMYSQVYILALVCIHLISTCTLYIRLYNDFFLYGLVFFLEPVLVNFTCTRTYLCSCTCSSTCECLPDHRLVDVLQGVSPVDPAVVGHHAWWTQFTIIKVKSLLRKCFVTVILSKSKEQHAWRQVLPPHVAGDGAAKELGGGEEA